MSKEQYRMAALLELSKPDWEASIDETSITIGAGPNARSEQGAWVSVWVPDPVAEIDPLEVYKRETE
jgi:hypothetical protein